MSDLAFFSHVQHVSFIVNVITNITYSFVCHCRDTSHRHKKLDGSQSTCDSLGIKNTCVCVCLVFKQ